MVRTTIDVGVVMRDGVRLSADVYLPDGVGPFPSILYRTPYDNSDWTADKARGFAGHGYATVVQDVRGRMDSQGEFYPFRNEGADGADTLSWMAAQPWCDGRIGMTGGSYLGYVQWAVAAVGHPNLRCLSPHVASWNRGRGSIYAGGALQLGFAATWGLQVSGRGLQRLDGVHWREVLRRVPLLDVGSIAERFSAWEDWLTHGPEDPYWDEFDLSVHASEATLPALLIGGWYDIYASQTIEAFSALRTMGRDEADATRAIIGPWHHLYSQSPAVGDLDFGPASVIDVEAEERRWFDRWLRRTDEVDGCAPLRIFVMGANRWRDEQSWPLERTDWQQWYLSSGGSAATANGDGRLLPTSPRSDEPVDRFTFDPAFPVQTTGGSTCCYPAVIAMGPYDQRDVEMRTDVLCYTSDPLDADLEVTGPVRLILYAATDGQDTDWTGKLVDVWPTGYAQNIVDGIIRARYRDGLAAPKPCEPGVVHRYDIDLGVTSQLFRRGHRIRLEVSSSNFPRFDINPNTGGGATSTASLRIARQTVHHDAMRRSHLLLPVVPGG